MKKFFLTSFFIFVVSVSLSWAWSDWSLITPGGNHISFNGKPHKGQGIHLQANIESPDEVFVSHIEQWRYYPDYVVGKTHQSFFAFNEISLKVEEFDSEEKLNSFIRQASLGESISPWMDNEDGHRSGWFFLYWMQCNTPGEYSSECGQLTQEKMRFQYRIHWKYACEFHESLNPYFQEVQFEGGSIKDFCLAMRRAANQ